MELLQNCKTKEQVDLVFQWGSENPQTGYYFKRQVENFRESARYLKRVDTINPNNENNIKNKLIIGDNYDALNNLIAGGYKEKIDVIYIDPPYGMDNEGEFAKTNYENKVTRDELLSMLEPRLELAKQLLSSEGCIFVQLMIETMHMLKCCLIKFLVKVILLVVSQELQLRLVKMMKN